MTTPKRKPRTPNPDTGPNSTAVSSSPPKPSDDSQLNLGLPTAKTSRFPASLPDVDPPSPLPALWIKLAPAVPTVAYDTYWRFAVERQAVFFRRLINAPPPWTDDPILERYKFTNAYRASDRVSQFLIRDVIYSRAYEESDTFFRLLFFKLFNKIETWQLVETQLGGISWRDYSFKEYDRLLTAAMARGTRIYSAAYIMPSGRVNSEVEPTKHRFHLRLLEQMMKDDVPARLARLRSMREAFALLLSYPSIGDFLAYQFVTDVNYSELTSFSEFEFVQPGPGALDGIRKCFTSLGGLSEAEIIRFMADRQEAEFERLGLKFQTLWGRRLQLIDCQNLFCEVGKYSRVRHPDITGVSDRKRIKQHFAPRRDPLVVWYPPKWGLNEMIAADLSSAETEETYS